MSVFYCNTEFDLHLAGEESGHFSYLTDVMSWLFVSGSTERDTLLVRCPQFQHYLEYLESCSIQYGKIKPISGFSDTGDNDPVVWGWDKQAYQLFNRSHPAYTYNTVKMLNSRSFSSKCERMLGNSHSVFCNDICEFEKALQSAVFPVVCKPEYGSSGRGFIRLASFEDYLLRKDSINTLFLRGGVSLEQWHDRLFDFSYGRGIAGTEGTLQLRLLHNRHSGQFSSLSLLPEKDIYSRFSHKEIDDLQRVYDRLCRILEEHAYTGPFGIDGYVYAVDNTRRMRFVSEINCRMTMADAASFFASRYDVRCTRLLSFRYRTDVIQQRYDFVPSAYSFDVRKKSGIHIMTPLVEKTSRRNAYMRTFLLLCGDSESDLDKYEEILQDMPAS